MLQHLFFKSVYLSFSYHSMFFNISTIFITWLEGLGWFFPYSKYVDHAQKTQAQGGKNEDGQNSHITLVDRIFFIIMIS